MRVQPRVWNVLLTHLREAAGVGVVGGGAHLRQLHGLP
mgnify:FL=1|jgi:hypothetical protein